MLSHWYNSMGESGECVCVCVWGGGVGSGGVRLTTSRPRRCKIALPFEDVHGRLGVHAAEDVVNQVDVSILVDSSATQ